MNYFWTLKAFMLSVSKDRQFELSLSYFLENLFSQCCGTSREVITGG